MMMRFYLVLVSACLLARSSALPIEGEPDVLVTRLDDDSEAQDEDYDEPEHYHVGFFSKLHSFIDAFRERMWNVRTELMSGIDVDDLPPNYSNATFHEEVVNGTRVQVNQTVYRKSDDGSNIYIFRKVVRVLGTDSEETTTAPVDEPTAVTQLEPLKETEEELPSSTPLMELTTTDISNDLPLNRGDI